jgi:hypothetical protein
MYESPSRSLERLLRTCSGGRVHELTDFETHIDDDETWRNVPWRRLDR